ncbi:unnamed protein product [Nezara viridula]|uniref:Uncharacterized protein n=1 Tax=Nezara viridula TaxID=85310 RepID=A0A9P0HDL5_NEZVI|nr:unnamed protein product [Nezara viridula]
MDLDGPRTWNISLKTGAAFESKARRVSRGVVRHCSGQRNGITISVAEQLPQPAHEHTPPMYCSTYIKPKQTPSYIFISADDINAKSSEIGDSG